MQSITNDHNEQKTAMIIGVSGQDGHYLSKFLLSKGYRVVGLLRASSLRATGHDDPEYPNVYLEFSDLTDLNCLEKAIRKHKPDEIYNLGAQSNVKISFELPEETSNIIAIGTIRLLEAIRACDEVFKKVRIFQAFTSDIFSTSSEGKQNEDTHMHPTSPYAVAKLYSYWIIKNYREAYNLFACNGILFSHESPRRSEQFVTRKITTNVARIVYGLQTHMELGNLEAKRDWSHAKDICEAMWLMLQQNVADDYCLASGELHTLREFCEKAFSHVGIIIEWKGERGTVSEYAVDSRTGIVLIKVNPEFFRPVDHATMWGDPSKAERELKWKRKYSFEQLVKEMMDYDLKQVALEMKKAKLKSM